MQSTKEKLYLSHHSTQGSKNEREIEDSKWEQVKKIELTPDEWSIDGGHLTPTMKLKRKVISEKYSNLIDNMYN